MLAEFRVELVQSSFPITWASPHEYNLHDFSLGTTARSNFDYNKVKVTPY